MRRHEPDGVLLARGDGVIVVAEAMPQHLREAPPLPREGVLKCGCVARYSKCYCNTNTENA